MRSAGDCGPYRWRGLTVTPFYILYISYTVEFISRRDAENAERGGLGGLTSFNTEARRHRDTENCILDRIYRINRMG